jgi:hypothetical protein
MRKILAFPVIITLLMLTMLCGCGFIPRLAGDRIIDHRCTDLSAIPAPYIQNAKNTLCIAYGHTSHGYQITHGMDVLDAFMGGTGLYTWNNDGSGGALELRNTPFSGAEDLGNPDRISWESATRTYLTAHTEINVIIWSWCGQVDGTEEEINTYLTLMNGLETDYPDVRFIYMTGHLNGTGLEGNVHLRNEQIRDFCRVNNKWLYDFADIETYDPDGIYYGDRYPTDGCNYDFDNDGGTSQTGDPALPTGNDRNWAIDWQDSHPEGPGGDWYDCEADHTQPLNANRKAYAAWWLWARLGGWYP